MSWLTFTLMMVVSLAAIVLLVYAQLRATRERREVLEAVAHAWGGRYIQPEVGGWFADTIQLEVGSVPVLAKQVLGGGLPPESPPDEGIDRSPWTRIRFRFELGQRLLFCPRWVSVPEGYFPECEERALATSTSRESAGHARAPSPLLRALLLSERFSDEVTRFVRDHDGYMLGCPSGIVLSVRDRLFEAPGKLNDFILRSSSLFREVARVVAERGADSGESCGTGEGLCRICGGALRSRGPLQLALTRCGRCGIQDHDFCSLIFGGCANASCIDRWGE